MRDAAWGRPAAVAAAAAVLAGPLGVAGCGGKRPSLALRPEPIPYADTLPIPEPEYLERDERVELFESGILSQLRFPVEGDRPEALNLTRFDDVVNSAWFEHRIDTGTMTPRDVARGPTDGAGPDTSRTLTVVAGKTEGISPGFTVRDARGDTYLLKFDAKEWTGLGSAAGVIANRLLHAAGYHVPEDYIAVFDPARLEVDPEAMVSTAEGEREMTAGDLQAVLEHAATGPDGLLRALASEFVPGKPKGPFRFDGTRDDDPNDHYHHEYRRELRGLFVVSAWLNHVDMRFANTLDSYVEPGYLRHYLIDFASSLGSSAGIRSHTPRHGEEYQFALWPTLARLATLGLVPVGGWEYREWEPIDPSVGWFDIEGYDPGSWKPGWPNQAFLYMTDRDGYWGAKIVASFDEEHIRAAVAEARLEPAAGDTLVRMLVGRRDATVAHWYGQVTPIEAVEVEAGPDMIASASGGSGPGLADTASGDTRPPATATASGQAPAGGGNGSRGAFVPFTVTFEDLGLLEGIWSAGETAYRWRFAHEARGIRLEGESAAGDGPRQRIEVVPGGDPPREADRRGWSLDLLAVLEITAVRPGADEDPATVHLRWDPDQGRYAVAGLEH